MKSFIKIMLATFALFAVVVGLVIAPGALMAINGNEWWPLQTYHGGTVTVPVTKTAAFTLDLDKTKYDLDSTAGAFLVSLPSSATTPPADGQCWELSLQVANGAVSLSPSAVGDLLDASQAAYAGMDAVGDSTTVCYDAGTTNYYFQSRYIH